MCTREEAVYSADFVCCQSDEKDRYSFSFGFVCTDLPDGAYCKGIESFCTSGYCDDDGLCAPQPQSNSNEPDTSADPTKEPVQIQSSTDPTKAPTANASSEVPIVLEPSSSAPTPTPVPVSFSPFSNPVTADADDIGGAPANRDSSEETDAANANTFSGNGVLCLLCYVICSLLTVLFV